MLRGFNDCAASRSSGIPRSTIRDWRRGFFKETSRSGYASEFPCPCRAQLLKRESDYAYLLGIYLGDGYIAPGRRGVWRLRITLDAKYPGIIDECAEAIESILPGQHAYRLMRKGCVEVSMYSKHWTCFFPQHGRGPKHSRPIKLEPWQETALQREPERFLRGLVHSDGCRVVAVDRGRPSARYAFSNRSDDIRGLSCAALDRLSIRWTKPSRYQIAIYRKECVARLDTFIGPKH